MIFNVSNAGGSASNLVHLIISYGDNYLNKTITATNGAEVHTVTTGSSAGVVTIDCKALGEWTLTCNATELKVDTTYYGNYEILLRPQGSTATPVNDIQTWLLCAGLIKNYTTIDQVLADTSVLSALISDNNASDYLVRSTNWASKIASSQVAMSYIGLNDYCANRLLSFAPWREVIWLSDYKDTVIYLVNATMTSDNTPCNKVTYSSYISTSASSIYNGYKAFNNTNSDGWTEYNADGWLQYEFDEKPNLYAIKLTQNGHTNATAVNFEWTILGSNNGETYQDVGTIRLDLPKSNTFIEGVLLTNKKFKYYRFSHNQQMSKASSFIRTLNVGLYGREA